MYTISIISASVRNGRKSNRVAIYFKNYIEENKIATPEIIDLDKYQFPVFNERLKFLKTPSDSILEFAGKIKSADAVLIVTPEYNGGYPAALKNLIDMLYDEWYHKPIGFITVSSGAFGGSQVITSLQFVLWKMKALTVPAMFPVAKVEETFDENGKPLDKVTMDKRAASFMKEVLWVTEACAKMK
ncbi:MAG: NAD(P)H-dependent oxidoreductase [Bacteroidia bacterium]|nr:NAD(P)H-dependent oxidoreductase [Bacteroidia bacterium]